MVAQRVLEDYIDTWIAINRQKRQLPDYWRESQVAFLSCDNPGIPRLRELVREDHLLPEDLMEGAKSIICFFLPFKKWLGKTNLAGDYASADWAGAYTWTNKLAIELGEALIEFLKKEGIKAVYPYEAVVFSEENPRSRWSQRHLAYFAGLGSFGINNLLISKKGSMGRYFSIVTDMEVDEEAEVAPEYCLYKVNKSCRVCIDRCSFDALSLDGFDRFKCLEQLNINKKILGASVCGKCAVALPCSFRVPGDLSHT